MLDVSCGAGGDLMSLAKLAGPDGGVAGALSLPIACLLGDAEYLTFADNTFHACLAERVFHHWDDAYYAPGEMAWVTLSGAGIVVSDPDRETLKMETADPSLTQVVVDVHVKPVAQGALGRKQYVMFCEAGH